jgi:hypothetical protein
MKNYVFFIAGDHVKFGFPQASAVTMLTWGLYQYKDASVGTSVSSANKIDRHNITEILLNVTLNIIHHKPNQNILTRHFKVNFFVYFAQ